MSNYKSLAEMDESRALRDLNQISNQQIHSKWKIQKQPLTIKRHQRIKTFTSLESKREKLPFVPAKNNLNQNNQYSFFQEKKIKSYILLEKGPIIYQNFTHKNKFRRNFHLFDLKNIKGKQKQHKYDGSEVQNIEKWLVEKRKHCKSFSGIINKTKKTSSKDNFFISIKSLVV